MPESQRGVNPLREVKQWGDLKQTLEAPRNAWDRFSGSHFAGMNDHDSFCAACEVLREGLERELGQADHIREALDRVFGVKGAAGESRVPPNEKDRPEGRPLKHATPASEDVLRKG